MENIRLLLKRTSKASAKHRQLYNELVDEMVKRYGIDPSEVDCESFIESASYGAESTLKDIDAEMEKLGYPRKDRK